MSLCYIHLLSWWSSEKSWGSLRVAPDPIDLRQRIAVVAVAVADAVRVEAGSGLGHVDPGNRVSASRATEGGCLNVLQTKTLYQIKLSAPAKPSKV